MILSKDSSDWKFYVCGPPKIVLVKIFKDQKYKTRKIIFGYKKGSVKAFKKLIFGTAGWLRWLECEH